MSEGSEPTPTRTETGRRLSRWCSLIAFIAGAILLLGYYARKPPLMHGDGWEYVNQIESLHSHGTPELRPEDLLAVDALTEAQGWGPAPRPPFAYYTAPDGRLYSVHFWGYSLSVVPAKAYLRATGGTELAAMQLTNAAWFVFAAFVVLFLWPVPVWKRVAYLALVSIGPVIWYLAFTGTEILSWAFVVIAMVAYDSRRYAWCSLAAAIASIQNPTLIFICGAGVALSLWERRWREAVLGCLATAPAFLPAVFFELHFGKPSLIAEGFVSASYISWAKTWGYAFDLNQGLVTFTPLLVLGAITGSARLLIRRSVPGVVMIGALVAVAVGTEVQVNWNSGCIGVMRYLVWMIPVVGWLMLEGLGSNWGSRVLAGAAVITSGIMVYIAPFEGGYLTHNPVAQWVLINHPRLYYPEPEVFVERIRNVETGLPREYPVPTGFVAPDGNVTKLLVDPANVEAVAEKYEATPEYMAALRAEAIGRRRHFYSHPPPGAVRVR